MGVVLATMRHRLADAEPQPEDRSAERKLGVETQSRAPHPEERVGFELSPRGAGYVFGDDVTKKFH